MRIAPAHLDALQALGYTEAEARFLYIVATHSGYFTARQFLAFTGAHWGKRTTTFWSRLHTRKHARTECFPKSGTVYHLFSRRLYRQIDRENIRNRREHEFEYIQRRIGMLDFVLLNQGYQYLETEPEKLRFFCGALNIPKHYLPVRLYLGTKSPQTSVRYFVDMCPEGTGTARHYVASGQWGFIGSRSETGQAPGLRDRGACMVAGAGFEPATSGL